MTSSVTIKELVLKQIMQNIEQRIDSAQKAINSAKESRDNETKSSVGDKYETGRTLMQMELEKNRVQLNKALTLKNELRQINLHKEMDKVGFGSLVYTSNGNYFVSAAVGKIEIKNLVVYSISLASPIGKVLQNKRERDKIQFQGKTLTLLKIN